ncbi:sodium/alanine symporter [Coraliomargarita sinensis]|uniref:Sodium/alanine symporter n=2 Tax=Coraliomargarita sinensis TaxID=2174842 RepID=A0A317ZGY8_9BACT|nr:sodium/alanine symporter [Coraliomargarita sinensis]
MWGPALIVLLVGGGLFLAIYSRFRPYLHFKHAVDIVRGKFDDSDDAGDIPHFQALSTALSGTLGLGNVAGVAAALSAGGPGAIFWMWVTAMVGIATKFYTCTLAVMYRGRDSKGHLQGGPMYVIREALGPHWRPLAVLFAVAALFGTLPVFQANQLVQLIGESAFDGGLTTMHKGIIGSIIMLMVAIVVLGDIRRVGQVTARFVPAMVVFYFGLCAYILLSHADQILPAFEAIFANAFSGQSIAGGALGTVIMQGVSRGAFSNEAGIGTEALAHGAAKTDEPVREGLVAMMGPAIDTLLVCTCTALVILVTGALEPVDRAVGVSLTAAAFDTGLPGGSGSVLLLFMVFFLSVSTMISFGYYGCKCFGFLAGAERQHWWMWFYFALIFVGSIASFKTVSGLVFGMYAVMAIPTMASTLRLAPRVNAASRTYFKKLR